MSFSNRVQPSVDTIRDADVVFSQRRNGTWAVTKNRYGETVPGGLASWQVDEREQAFIRDHKASILRINWVEAK